MGDRPESRTGFAIGFFEVSHWVFGIFGVIPVILISFMRSAGWLTEPLIFHGVMNYLLMMILMGLIWAALLTLKWERTPTAKKWALWSMIPSIAFSLSGLDMEYLMVGFLPFVPLILMAALKRRARILHMALLFFMVSCGVTYVHHFVFLSGITKPWIEQREARMQSLVSQGVGQGAPGCEIEKITYELCLSFPDALLGQFLEREDLKTMVEEIRVQQASIGTSVGRTMNDKNDNVPVWAFGFDGNNWSVLKSHDTFYRDMIVPAMGYLWWWSVLVWGVFGISVILWHTSRPPFQRRKEAMDILKFALVFVILSSVGVCVLGFSFEVGFLQAKIAPGDWITELEVMFFSEIQRVAIIIPIAWIAIGTALWGLHLLLIK